MVPKPTTRPIQRLAGWLSRAARRYRTITHGRGLAVWLVRLAVRILPYDRRVRYEREWLAELDVLERRKQALLGVAVGIAMGAPRLGLMLRFQGWVRSPAAKRLGRLEPVWVGLGAALAAFFSIAVGLWTPDGRAPSRLQIGLALLGSALSGGLAAWQARKRRHTRRHSKQSPTDRGELP
jgi:hypothetical protein